MPFIHDIIVVGAGPCGLGLATRFCEHTPAEHYTDEEHRRYHWIRRNTFGTKKRFPSKDSAPDTRASIHCPDSNYATGAEREIGQQLGDYHTLFIDATSNRFLSRWNSNFETFGIRHLRSPMFFHVDPADRDGLLAFAQESARYRKECEEIRGVVGQEISKHARKQRFLKHHKHQAIGKDTNVDERQRQDYFVPSTELFHDHCGSLIKRYKLDEDRLIVKDVVADIDYGLVEDIIPQDSNVFPIDVDKIFKVTTWEGEYFAKAVVLAIGPSMPLNSMVSWPECSCHSSQIQEFPSFDVQKKIKLKLVTHVLIIGGGLTSAQLALRAISKGVSKVWLIMRGPLKVKHFDLTLEWVGKFKNQEKATFWSADTDEERFDMIRKARNGGSIPLKYKRLLDEQVDKGRLQICTHTTLRTICKNQGNAQTQSVLTEPPICGLPDIDYVYFATGPRNPLNSLSMPTCCGEEESSISPDAALPIPFLENMQQRYPIHWLNGLPVLDNDLAWSSVEPDKESRTIPLFMTGALAALRLGPGAANLEGARTGAERVAWGIQDVLGTSSTKIEQLAQGLNAYLTGIGGRFDGLGELDDY